MPTFLADPPQIVYLILGGLLVITGLVAAQRQDRRWVSIFAIAFFLMLLVFLIDRFNNSPREEAVERSYLMAQAADMKNPDAFVVHLADNVTIASGNDQGKVLSREEIKNHPFWNMLKHLDVHVAVWDFSRDDVKQIDDNTIEIGFYAKGSRSGGEQFPVYIRATFAKQPDGSFKLTTLRTFDPLNHNAPLNIPGLP